MFGLVRMMMVSLVVRRAQRDLTSIEARAVLAVVMIDTTLGMGAESATVSSLLTLMDQRVWPDFPDRFVPLNLITTAGGWIGVGHFIEKYKVV